MAAPKPSRAIRRLLKDQQELLEFPVENVSAAPLESNIFEWHCNIRQNKDTIYHIILYFPQDYPFTSPSAEFVPRGLQYRGGAVERGKKGDRICLSIFSDFAKIHTEWANEKGTGWSPGYTAQTVLLNLVSFLAELDNGNDIGNYHKFCRKFECSDCGHTHTKPFPSLDISENNRNPENTMNVDDQLEVNNASSQIIDYISKEAFKSNQMPCDNALFGYGLILTQRGYKSMLTTPCEFLTSSTFYGMQNSTGKIHSVMKEELSFFLPLYIDNFHGSHIEREFENTLNNVAPYLLPSKSGRAKNIDVILDLLPNLMCSTVVEFSKGNQHTSDNHLQGYFALHRLFLWALNNYPGLEDEIEHRILQFVSDPSNRSKNACPDIGKWLMLLSVCKQHSWKEVSGAYLEECFRRNVMWYLKSDPQLNDMDAAQKYRINNTFKETAVSRNMLAFQVAFLRIAKPADLTPQQILDRYDRNFGIPEAGMISNMKQAFQTIQSGIKSYTEWFHCLGLQAPSNEQLFNTLKDSVVYAKSTKGYFFTENNNQRNSNRGRGAYSGRGTRGQGRGGFVGQQPGRGRAQHMMYNYAMIAAIFSVLVLAFA